MMALGTVVAARVVVMVVGAVVDLGAMVAPRAVVLTSAVVRNRESRRGIIAHLNGHGGGHGEEDGGKRELHLDF